MTPNSSLLQWLATFQLDDRPAIELRDDAYYNLADGFVCAKILNQISPIYFTDKWLDGIKPVAPNGSWRLRVSNLKRILQKIHDYASDLQNSQFMLGTINPDVTVIAQNFEPGQISRLIQLILFCAINCDRKQNYIEKIRDLPTQVKHDIKEAIEELLVKNADAKKLSGRDEVNVTQQRAKDSPQSFLDESSETINEMRKKVDEANQIRDEKIQACHELETKFKQLQIERDQLLHEVVRVESEREDYRLKSTLLKEDLDKMTFKHEELRNKAEHAKRLQDELDEHKHLTERVISYETVVDNLVKKNSDLKREIRLLEEKDLQRTQSLALLEQENKQLAATINQMEAYRRQLNNAQSKLSQETHRADKLEVELSRLTERFESTKKENERLFAATNQLARNSSRVTHDETSGTVRSSDDVTVLIKRVEDLQRLLNQKEQDLRDAESRYKKNIDKAKEVIKALNNNQSISSSLHPSCMSSVSFNSGSLDEISSLKILLREKEERLIELEREFLEFRKLKEVHERLILSAFYGLTTPMQWKNAEKRLERDTLTAPAGNASSQKK